MRRREGINDLTQILRLCVSGRFKPELEGEGLLRVMARGATRRDFSSLQARVKETRERSDGVQGGKWAAQSGMSQDESYRL